MSVYAVSKYLNIPKSCQTTPKKYAFASFLVLMIITQFKRGTYAFKNKFVLKKCNAPAAHLQRGNWSVQTQMTDFTLDERKPLEKSSVICLLNLVVFNLALILNISGCFTLGCSCVPVFLAWCVCYKTREWLLHFFNYAHKIVSHIQEINYYNLRQALLQNVRHITIPDRTSASPSVKKRNYKGKI